MNIFKVMDRHLYLFFIVIISVILCLPQAISGNMILGSDSIFHFNRFYDTAQQLKNFNFQYYISMYGFHESGRIVNALYGPLFAYFHGFLVLISKNWFLYQLLSNFCLYNLAGFSMYTFLLKGGLERKYALSGAILFLSTYSIQYWAIRQGFTSWGAALLPLALSILFELNLTQRIPRWKLGILTALLVQAHMLSAFVLVLIYFPFFIYFFLKSKNKIVFFRHLMGEVFLFFCLTLNIWGAYLNILKGNHLIRPIVNHNMSLNTINQNSYYWLLNPVILIFMLVTIYYIFLKKWKQINSIQTKLWFWIMTIFLVLSSSLIPWSYLVKVKNPVAELIQFPFRFFVPVSIITIYLFLKLIQNKQILKNKQREILIFFLVISQLQTIALNGIAAASWHSSSNFMPSNYKVKFLSDIANIKKSFYDVDKGKALNLVVKGTPDYLPLYGIKNENTNYYDLYLEMIVPQKKFKKFVRDGKLIIEWTGNADSMTEVPIIIYQNTVINLNGERLSHDQISLSSIGIPKIHQISYKKNQIILSYNVSRIEVILLIGTILTWLTIVVALLKEILISSRS